MLRWHKGRDNYVLYWCAGMPHVDVSFWTGLTVVTATAAPDITLSFRMIDAFFAECSRQYLVSADSFDYFCAFLRDANRQLVDDIKAIVSREDLSHRDRLWLVTGRLRQHAGSPRKLN